MRKFARITGIVLMLVTLLGLCSGCVRGDTMTTLYLGVPWAEDSETYQDVMLAIEDSNMFTESNFVKIEMVTYGEDADSKKSFLKKMDNGGYAFFYYDRDELLDPYIESGRLASIVEIQQVYPSCFEKRKQFVLDTSTDSNGVNHQLSLKGSYQGVFFNEELFLQYGLSVPKTWEQFTAVIDTFKANGVTPFAGGFADGGMKYWIDELILMEGGVAEHSYVPKYGVVNSWARAVNDLKALCDSGTFNSDAMTMSYADAVSMFNSGSAAMILADSKDIATDDADTDKLGVFSLPVTTTGKKNIGDIICDYNSGIYINSQYLTKKAEIIDCIIEFVVNYLDGIAEEEYEGDDYENAVAIPLDYSYEAYKSNWSLPANPYTIGIEPVIKDDETTSPEDQLPVDPTIPEVVVEDDTLQHRVFKMMEHTTEAGRSLTTEFKTFDYFIDLVKGYIQNGGDIEALLTDATNKEVEAQKAPEVAPAE